MATKKQSAEAQQMQNVVLLLTTKEAEQRFASAIENQLELSGNSDIENAATLQSMGEAVKKLEPKFRAAALAFLLASETYKEEAESGKHFLVDGVEVCVQQVPTYDYQGDAEEVRMAAAVQRMEKELAAKRKKLKGHREGLVAAGKAKLLHLTYNLQIFRK